MTASIHLHRYLIDEKEFQLEPDLEGAKKRKCEKNAFARDLRDEYLVKINKKNG